ncbi:MAG: FAD-dependent oxidoreductase, partial [Clostridia bacterium]
MKICVIGGGAAGMFAAIFAARAGAEVILLEKNEKLGKK